MNSTLVLGVASIALALVFLLQSESLPAVALRLPSLLIWLVIGLAVMMIAEEFLKRRAERRAGPGNALADDDEPLPPINWSVLFLFGAAIVAYVTLIPYVGYLVMTTVFITGALLAAGTMHPLKAVLIGVLTTAFVWAVFIWALGLPVPLLPYLK